MERSEQSEINSFNPYGIIRYRYPFNRDIPVTKKPLTLLEQIEKHIEHNPDLCGDDYTPCTD